MVEKFTSMMSSNCAPVPMSINAERSSSESTITDLSMDLVAQTQHDPVYSSDKTNGSDNNRPTKRNCIVCGMKTRFHCSHPECKRRAVNHKSQNYFGTPICSHNVPPRKHMEEHGGEENTQRCIEIHRKQMATLCKILTRF